MLTIIIAAVVCSMLSHLGLLRAIGRVCARVFNCTKCATFWLCVAYCLYVRGYGFAKTFCISAVASYLSVWIEMFYVVLNQKYNALWERLTK